MLSLLLTQWTKKRLNCFKVIIFYMRINLEVFILVELGANGRTAQEWKKLLPYLRSRLAKDCNVSFFDYAL